MHSRTTVTNKLEYFKRSRKAITKAAQDAREIGIKSGTGIVVVKKGRLVNVSAQELESEILKPVKIRKKSIPISAKGLTKPYRG